MANPQLENGHLELAHEIVESLARIRISGTEWQLLWVILRKTYGWHRKVDAISLSQFQAMTGLSRPHISRYLKKLLRKKVIVLRKDGGVRSYGFNKDFDEWEPLPKKAGRPGGAPRPGGARQPAAPEEARTGQAPEGRASVEGGGGDHLPRERRDGHERNTGSENRLLERRSDAAPRQVAAAQGDVGTPPGDFRKERYGPHVELTADEYGKLVERFTPEAIDDVIELFNLKIESKGVARWRTYHESDYATILYWARNGWIRLPAEGSRDPGGTSPASASRLMSTSSRGIMGWAARERERSNNR